MKRPTRARLFERRREMANFALAGWTQAAANPGGAEFAGIQAVTSTPELWRARLPRRPPSRDLTAHRCHSSPPPLPRSRREERGAPEIVGTAPATEARHFSVDGPLLFVHSHHVVAHSHDAYAHKGPLCASFGCVREFCASPPCIRTFSDFRAILGGGAVPRGLREYGDLNAGPNWGSGEDGHLAMQSRSLKKMRISALRDR